MKSNNLQALILICLCAAAKRLWFDEIRVMAVRCFPLLSLSFLFWLVLFRFGCGNFTSRS